MISKRNRAKCRSCNHIIESLAPNDLQVCSCGKIAIEGSRAIVKDPYNFLSVDDDGVETELTFDEPAGYDTKPTELNRETLIDMLKLHIESYDNLPDHAKYAPVTVYDLQSLAILVHSIFKA